MGIVRADASRCTVLTHEGLHMFPCHTHTQGGNYFIEHLFTPATPYLLGIGDRYISGILLSDSWEVHLGKLRLELNPQNLDKEIRMVAG